MDNKTENSDSEPSQDVNEQVKLKRRFGLHNGVAIIVGLILGISIYMSPTGVIRGTRSGGLALVVWVLCGVISTLGALTFAELGTTYPVSGSMYVYLQKMYGPFVAFQYQWEYYLLHRPAANAIKSLLFALYVIQPFFPGCDPPDLAVKLIAVAFATVITYINIVDLRLTARGQNLFVFATVASLLFLIIVAAVHTIKNGTPYLSDTFSNINSDIGEIVVGVYSGIFAYGGWEALNFMVEEVKNPIRNLPVAVIISMSLVTALYTCVNLSYLCVLGPEGIMATDVVGVKMLQRAIGPASIVMSIMIAFNCAGSFNSGTLVGSRLGFVSARRGHLPQVLALIHIRFRSPISSLILQLLLVVTCCFIGDPYFILNNIVFANTLFWTLTAAGHIYLRLKEPDRPRPLKMPLVVPLAFLVCNLVLVIIPLILKPMSCVSGLAISFGTGTLYYILVIVKPFELRSMTKLSDRFTRWTQGFLLAAMTDKHEF